jgi:hypothetical protein
MILPRDICLMGEEQYTAGNMAKSSLEGTVLKKAGRSNDFGVVLLSPTRRRAERSLVALTPSPDLFVHARELLVEARREPDQDHGCHRAQVARDAQDLQPRRRSIRRSCRRGTALNDALSAHAEMRREPAQIFGRHRSKADTAGRLCGKPEASDAGNVVVLAFARTPR